MSDNQTYEKLQKLMHSYVPEFAYEHGASDPGCVLTDLCGTMMAGSAMEKSFPDTGFSI